MNEKIEALTAENKNCRTMLNDNRERARLLQEEITERDKQNRRLATENDKLKADLKKHGGHTSDCQMIVLNDIDADSKGPNYPKCTCGWSEIEQALKKKEGE